MIHLYRRIPSKAVPQKPMYRSRGLLSLRNEKRSPRIPGVPITNLLSLLGPLVFFVCVPGSVSDSRA